MAGWIGVAVFVAVLVWFLFPKQRAVPAPEDDVTTPIDHAALEQAERELKRDAGARSVDEVDDWGPGTV